MPDFSHDEHVKRTLEDAGHFRRHHNPATRQTEYHIHLNRLLQQVAPQSASGIFAGQERHIT